MSISFKSLVMTAAILVLAGCSGVQKNSDYMAGQEYQGRSQLHQSLLGPNDTLSEEAIQKILTSKVSLPKAISLAVVRLSDSADGLDFQTIDKEIAEQFYGESNWGGRVQSVIPMPHVMLAKPITLSSLRQAAVLLQADALVIIKPVSFGDVRYQLFEENKAQGITSLEVLLLDTRTSVVPYTAFITEKAEVLKERSDYGDYQTMARAKKASEAKALLQVAPAIQKFISKAM